MIKLKFELNFHLPVVEDITFISGFPDFATFKYRFIETSRVTNIRGFEDIPSTTILIEYFPEMPEKGNLSDPRSAFANCFIFLNNFIDVYRFVNGLEQIKNFTILDLPPYIIMNIDGADVLYTLPQFFELVSKPETSTEMVDKALSQLNLWRLRQPLEVIDKFLSKAIHHIYNEEYVFAIIELQTSFESYIRLCQHIILEKEGASEEDIEKSMMFPLKNTIEQYLAKGLNENLKIGRNEIMTKWHNTLYKNRNDIVHSGLSYITGDEVYSSYYAYQVAVNYLSDLMVREKLITPEKKVNITSLNKNIHNGYDEDTILEILKSKGIASFLEDQT